MPLAVRRVKVSDLPILEALELESTRRLPQRSRWMETFRRLLEEALSNEPEGLLVADYDGRPVGAAIVRVRGEHPLSGQPYGRIEALSVAPGWRNQGVGERLLKEAEAWLKVRGCKAVTVTLPSDGGSDAEVYKNGGYAVSAWELERTL